MEKQEQAGISMWDAQKQFSSILVPEPETPDEESVQEDDPEIEAVDEAADIDDGLEVEDDLDDEAIEADADEQESDDEDDGSERYTVRVDGEELEVTLPELIAGYSRQSDYTRKTQALSEERKTLEQEAEQLRQERQQYAAALPRLQEMLESSLIPEPKPGDYTDRAEYLWAKDQWTAHQQQVEAVRAERERIMAQQQQDAMAKWQQVMAQEHERLLEKLPEWKNEKVRTKEQTELADYLRREGYGEEEINSLVDHRAVMIARKAKLFDELQLKGKKKAKKATKAVQPQGRESRSARGAMTKQIEHAKKTGKVDDAARVLGALLTQ